ncbi:MAG: ATPase, T2SS/T4P/T4SS family [Phycisphaerales bacterium]
MGKHDLDDILNQLSEVNEEITRAAAEGSGPMPGARPGPVARADGSAAPVATATKTARKKAAPGGPAEEFSPLPAVPTGQRSFNHTVAPEQPPRVLPAPPSAKTIVGRSLSEVYKPDSPEGAQKVAELGEVLVERGACTAQQLTLAQNVIRQSPGRGLVEVLLEQGAVESKVQECVAELAGLPFEHIDLNKGLDGGFDGGMVQRLTVEFCKEHMIIPLRQEGSRAVLGVIRPGDVFLYDEVRRKLGVAGIKTVLVTAFEAKGALEILGGGAEQAVDMNQLLAEVHEGDVSVEKQQSNTEVDLEKEAGESPVIKLVNAIIQQAVKEGASDIHIEPADKKLKVRFRIDGELFESMQPPASMAAAITSRLKIMANLDISERRLPQDGRIRCTVQNRKLDLRMSTLPNGYGEKTVMRILDTKSINVKLEDLGFEEDTLRIWRGLVDAPHGVVLVTGPTGSGKTTTLYSSLKQIDKNSMNVCTVEDPVEYHLEGITQTQTHEKIGMTFGKALKSLLRQDPDVIMVGEIRDHETALTAIQAALTGHLVLSTLHTNDAPSSITRLVNIGIEPFLVGAALNGVLAQRLIRRLCKNCVKETVPTEEMAEFLRMQGLSAERTYSPKGCEMCRNIGYKGRLGIYELLTVDDQLRDVVARNPNVAELRRMCLERGMVTLRVDGLRKAAQGRTSVEEVLRVTESTH